MAEAAVDPQDTMAASAEAVPVPSSDSAAEPSQAEPQRKLSKRKSSVKKAEAAEASEGGGPTEAPVSEEGSASSSSPPPADASGGGEIAAQQKVSEKKDTTRMPGLRKSSKRMSVAPKIEGDEFDDSEEEEETKIIYPIDPKIQETLRKAWSLFIKKQQKKKTEIAELDIPTVMRSIAINPTETQVKDLIAYTRSQDVSTTSKGFLTYECFEQRMAESFELEPDKYIRNGKERILNALYVISLSPGKTITGGKEEMEAAVFKKILMTKGDAMTEQEAALMVRDIGDRDTGKIYVEEYADILFKDGIPQPPSDPTVW